MTQKMLLQGHLEGRELSSTRLPEPEPRNQLWLIPPCPPEAREDDKLKTDYPPPRAQPQPRGHPWPGPSGALPSPSPAPFSPTPDRLAMSPKTGLLGSAGYAKKALVVFSVATSLQLFLTITPLFLVPLLPAHWGTDLCSGLPLPTTPQGQVPGMATFLFSQPGLAIPPLWIELNFPNEKDTQRDDTAQTSQVGPRHSWDPATKGGELSVRGSPFPAPTVSKSTG